MAYSRKPLPEEEMRRLCADGRKKFVKVDEGAALYSIGITTFKRLAREAKAVYHINKTVLVNIKILDEYMEMFRDEI